MSTYGYIYLGIIAVLAAVIIYEHVTGRPIFTKIDAGKPILEALKLLVKACAGVFPSAYFDTASVVIEAAVDAAIAAEKLWKTGQIDKSERSNYCQLIIADALKQAGIVVTDQIQEIIRGSIAIVCMLMPHSGLAEDVREDKKELPDGKDER